MDEVDEPFAHGPSNDEVNDSICMTFRMGALSSKVAIEQVGQPARGAYLKIFAFNMGHILFANHVRKKP